MERKKERDMMRCNLNFPSASSQNLISSFLCLFSQDGDIFVSNDHPEHGDRPWTQQSLGCGRPGDFIYLPQSFISSRRRNATFSRRVGRSIADEWLRYRYGIFDAYSTELRPESRQYSLCLGESTYNVVNEHADFNTLQSNMADFVPNITFTIGRALPTKYVIALEYSEEMNSNGHWNHVTAAVKKFLKQDLDEKSAVGLVLFHAKAKTQVPVSIGSNLMISNELPNAYLLANTTTVFRNAMDKSLEALRADGVIILISQGGKKMSVSEQEREYVRRLEKHRVELYSVALPIDKLDEHSVMLEEIAHGSGGTSFFIGKDDDSSTKSGLSTYVGVVDALREIQARVSDDGPFLVRDRSIPQPLLRRF